jgi:5-methylthioribose kinase
MLELTEQNAAEILHAHGHLPDSRTAKVRELSGGVSNAVFLIEQDAERFVVKQARGKLRVQADWQCSVERIWREVEVLWAFYGILKPDPGSLPKLVPEVLWTDRELYAYAMTAAGEGSRPWKELLLAGQPAIDIAIDAACLLSDVHGQSWHEPDVLERFGDRTYFVQLRLEPYYLAAAENYLPLREPLRDLVDKTLRERHALVHGDYSPKNMLVGTPPFFLIDFEVGHYGDPAFDVGFFLTHLVLKTIHLPGKREFLLESIRRFWDCYATTLRRDYAQERLAFGLELASDLPRLEQRCVQHLAGCLVARVHGKSPVDYLTQPEQLRAVALAEKLFDLGPAANWNDAYQLLQRET